MMREKREKIIWIINEYAGSPYHGMEYRHFYLCKEFLKKGYRCYIITASSSHLLFNPPKVNSSFKIEKIDGINYVWVKVPHYKHSRDKLRVLKWLVFAFKTFFDLPINSIEKPDIIIVSPIANFPILSGYKWGKKLKAKLIYEVKDLWPLTLIELGGYSSSNPLVWIMSKIEKFGYKKFDAVVSVLPLAYNYMRTRGLSYKKFFYIPNGVKPVDIETKSKNGSNIVPENKFVIAYAGSLGPANAIKTLVEAAYKLRNFEDIYFLIIGEGSEKKHIESMIQDMKLKNVKLFPYMHKSDVFSILKKSDIAYIGLKSKNIFKFGVSPNKLFDYMLAGKPILYAIKSGNNIVEDAHAGITVEAENPDSVARGILEFYKMSPEERKKLGDNGRRYVLQYHTYNKLAEKYISLFESLLGRNNVG